MALQAVTARCFSPAIVVILLAASAAHAALKISNQPTKNVTCSKGVCTATAPRAVLNVGDLANMLASGDAKVVSGSEARDIEIDTALSWTSTSRLTLDSFHAIAVNKPVSVTGTGALTITTNDGGSGGDFQFIGKGRVQFWDTNNWDTNRSLIINGSQYALAGNMRHLIKYATEKRGPLFIALAKSLPAGGKTYSAAPIPQYNGTIEGLGNTVSNF